MNTQEDADALYRDTYHDHPTPYEVGQTVQLAPCIPFDTQELLIREIGRVCPRVDLLPGNQAAAEMAWLLIQPPLKAAYSAMVMAYAATMEPILFRRAVTRSIKVSRDERIVTALERLAEEQKRKAEKDSKAKS